MTTPKDTEHHKTRDNRYSGIRECMSGTCKHDRNSFGACPELCSIFERHGDPSLLDEHEFIRAVFRVHDAFKYDQSIKCAGAAQSFKSANDAIVGLGIPVTAGMKEQELRNKENQSIVLHSYALLCSAMGIEIDASSEDSKKRMKIVNTKPNTSFAATARQQWIAVPTRDLFVEGMTQPANRVKTVIAIVLGLAASGMQHRALELFSYLATEYMKRIQVVSSQPAIEVTNSLFRGQDSPAFAVVCSAFASTQCFGDVSWLQTTTKDGIPDYIQRPIQELSSLEKALSTKSSSTNTSEYTEIYKKMRDTKTCMCGVSWVSVNGNVPDPSSAAKQRQSGDQAQGTATQYKTRISIICPVRLVAMTSKYGCARNRSFYVSNDTQ